MDYHSEITQPTIMPAPDDYIDGMTLDEQEGKCLYYFEQAAANWIKGAQWLVWIYQHDLWRARADSWEEYLALLNIQERTHSTMRMYSRYVPPAIALQAQGIYVSKPAHIRHLLEVVGTDVDRMARVYQKATAITSTYQKPISKTLIKAVDEVQWEVTETGGFVDVGGDQIPASKCVTLAGGADPLEAPAVDVAILMRAEEAQKIKVQEILEQYGKVLVARLPDGTTGKISSNLMHKLIGMGIDIEEVQ